MSQKKTESWWDDFEEFYLQDLGLGPDAEHSKTEEAVLDAQEMAWWLDCGPFYTSEGEARPLLVCVPHNLFKPAY